jgi:peptide deformylase
MAILRIARMGHPVLRQVAEPVPPERIPDPSIQQLIDDMLETLRDYEGAGLAAPQVHVPLRIVVLVLESSQAGVEAEPVVIINPEITFLTQNMLRSYEGCLSVPDLRAAVNRVGKIRLDAVDRTGEPITLELEGFGAIATQHECDHLDGVLYVDRCDLGTLTFLDELRRFGPLDPSFRKPGAPDESGGPDGDPPADGGDEQDPEPSREARASGRSGVSAAPASRPEESLVMAGGPRAEG